MFPKENFKQHSGNLLVLWGREVFDGRWCCSTILLQSKTFCSIPQPGSRFLRGWLAVCVTECNSCWGVGGVDTESDRCWGVGPPSLIYCFTWLVFQEYWFPQCWTLYYKDVSSLADDLKGVECSAVFVSLVLLDQDFITQFDAGGTGHALYAACIKLYF